MWILYGQSKYRVQEQKANLMFTKHFPSLFLGWKKVERSMYVRSTHQLGKALEIGLCVC